MNEKNAVCNKCGELLRELFKENEEGESFFAGMICEHCNCLYTTKNNQDLLFQLNGDNGTSKPIKAKCKSCGQYIVHPERIFSICLDCLIQKLLEKKALDISVMQYKRKE